MNLLGIGSIVETVGKIADDLITSDQERAQMALEERKLDLEAQRVAQTVDLAQTEVNKAEAGHASLFVAGWRPAIGWIGGAAMAYQFLAYPLLQWGWAVMQSRGLIPAEFAAPPVMASDQLWVILSGILGIAGMRTYEKRSGVTK
jgi:hypothetical protein